MDYIIMYIARHVTVQGRMETRRNPVTADPAEAVEDQLLPAVASCTRADNICPVDSGKTTTQTYP